MIVAIIVGGAILIGSLILFGPIGLVFAVIAAVCYSWFFSKDAWTISEKDKQHAREVDEALGFGKKE